MHNNSAIFAISTILLVPFLYYTASLPNACALPPDPNFGGRGCTSKTEPGKHIETCCWFEAGTGTGLIKLREKYCQTCTTPSGGQTTCDQKELQYIGTPSESNADSGVLQDPSTGSGPKASEGGFLGDLKNKITSSQSNTSSSNATK
jgi:hypothetical protein